MQIRNKGKGAIDVICNPLGKSGGALIQQFMIIGFGSLAASTPYLGVVLMLMIAVWIRAASTLGGLFKEEQKVKALRDAQELADNAAATIAEKAAEGGPAGAAA
jgi:ATP:ADP antiporter, AAA family